MGRWDGYNTFYRRNPSGGFTILHNKKEELGGCWFRTKEEASADYEKYYPHEDIEQIKKALKNVETKFNCSIGSTLTGEDFHGIDSFAHIHLTRGMYDYIINIEEK